MKTWTGNILTVLSESPNLQLKTLGLSIFDIADPAMLHRVLRCHSSSLRELAFNDVLVRNDDMRTFLYLLLEIKLKRFSFRLFSYGLYEWWGCFIDWNDVPGEREYVSIDVETTCWDQWQIVEDYEGSTAAVSKWAKTSLRIVGPEQS
jgi:hypothetical protein